MGMTARPVLTRPIPDRVVVVGCAGSGKTTLARELAALLDARHIERGALGDDEAPGFASVGATEIRRRTAGMAMSGIMTVRTAARVFMPRARRDARRTRSRCGRPSCTGRPG